MIRILRQNIWLLITAFAFFSCNAWSYNSSKIIEKNLDSNIINEIEDAFLFTKNERNSIKNNSIIRSHNPKNDDSEPRFGFQTDGSDEKIDIDKKTKERVAYNSYINGQYEVALKIYKDLVAKYPADNYPKYCLALTYQNLKQFKKAKIIYLKLLQDNPNNKQEIIANLITVLSHENPNRALFLLSKLARQNPENGYFLAQKALVFKQINQIDQAINSLQQAINIEPDNIEFQLNLAILFDQNKDFEKALMQYQRVLKSYKNQGNNNIPINQIVLRIDAVKNLI